ncbi:MAG TPA: hypothetical protein VM821_05825 [Abditibacteriaceae bacterium]|nr:hypothetical protein [Abditibacteriaceae bacterium]
MNLLQLLEELLPQICDWAQSQESHILQNGVALSPDEMATALQISVRHPERLRLLRVSQVPMPQDAVLRTAAEQAGLVSPHTAGMALRYGIFIRDDVWDHRSHIVAHELVHTAQYERLGGFARFLKQYLSECLTVGYAHSPLEQEAIRTANRLQDQR